MRSGDCYEPLTGDGAAESARAVGRVHGAPPADTLRRKSGKLAKALKTYDTGPVLTPPVAI